MESYWLLARAHAVDERRRCSHEKRVLSVAHHRSLEHQVRGGITAGFEEWWDEELIDLEAWDLMRGQWIGSLAYEAHPFWSITDEGRRRLREATATEKPVGT